METTVYPITNKLITGTAIVDVVLIDGMLQVRLIDYRSTSRGEKLYQSPAEIDLEAFPKYIQAALKKACNHCHHLAVLFSTHNLSDDARTLLDHIARHSAEYPVVSYKRVLEDQVLPRESIRPTLELLYTQYKLQRHNTNHYYYNTEFEDVRSMYVENKNTVWLTRAF
ncbi:hypothetical protein [Marinoscillum furvescens]|uniref:Uncharacterized protein n=1 Tax=Marinoscillum furvescens DSM 4134 TaxID=1122208 RepID=A0A3D9L3D3_MARFU|nr:hypothetical protein [Marinoscillum furvescens]RED97881.1 hypothetical protein C7460_11122 [Marinoscillum furvescens DSM 4134]